MYMFSILNLMKKDSLYNHGMCVPNMGHAMMVMCFCWCCRNEVADVF